MKVRQDTPYQIHADQLDSIYENQVETEFGHTTYDEYQSPPSEQLQQYRPEESKGVVSSGNQQ